LQVGFLANLVKPICSAKKLSKTQKMKKYVIWCKNLILVILQYRLNFFLSFLSVIVPLIIQISLWKTIFGFTGIDSIKGYTLGNLIVYYVLANWLATALGPSMRMKVVSDISTGGLNHYLIKPVNYLICRSLDILVGNLLFSVTGLIIIIPIAIFLFKEYFIGIFLVNCLYGLPFIFLAFILSVEISTILSLMSFFIDYTTSVNKIQFLIMPFLTGQLLPIELFPEKIKTIIQILPFQYLVLKPVQIFMGKISPANITKDFLIMALWIALFAILTYSMWHSGMRRYNAYGG